MVSAECPGVRLEASLPFVTMFLTGVDWSGDPGADSYGPGNPGYLCFAFASIDSDDLPALNKALATVRSRHGLVGTYVFKHSGSSDRIRGDFLEAVEHIELQVRVMLVDKSRDWPPEFWRFTGNQRIASCVAEGVGRLPSGLVDGHTLLLDLNQKKDGRFCTMIIKAAHRSTRTGQRHGFRKVKCCPDTHNTHGEIVQVADMVAGTVRKAATIQPHGFPQLQRIVAPW